jgi:hypothetical protein
MKYCRGKSRGMTTTGTTETRTGTPVPEKIDALDNALVEKFERQAVAEAGYPKGLMKVDVRRITRVSVRVNVWVQSTGGDYNIVKSGRVAYSAIYPVDQAV